MASPKFKRRIMLPRYGCNGTGGVSNDHLATQIEFRHEFLSPNYIRPKLATQRTFANRALQTLGICLNLATRIDARPASIPENSATTKAFSPTLRRSISEHGARLSMVNGASTRASEPGSASMRAKIRTQGFK